MGKESGAFMKDITVNFEKFNKAVKPFLIRYKGKKTSVVFYKDVAEYLFELHKRIVQAIDLADTKNSDI